jgi:diguanylate cyclase (GGDEF)-like protein/PAS domain S-box-containing protein
MPDQTGNTGRPEVRSYFWNTLGGRFMIVIGVLIIAVTALAGVSAWRARVNSSLQNDTQTRFEAATSAQQAFSDWLRASVLTDGYIDSQDPSRLPMIGEAQTSFDRDINQAIEAYRALGEDAEVSTVTTIRDGFAPLWASLDEILNKVQRGDIAGAEQARGDLTTASASRDQEFFDITTDERIDVAANNAAASAAARNLIWILIAAIVATITFGILGAMWIIRSAVRPLSNLGKTARAVGEGDLSIRAEVSGPQEVCELASVVNTMAERVAQREGALRVSEAYWRSLIQNAQDVVIVIDVAGVVRYVSPAIQRMLGHSPDSLLGLATGQLIHPDDLAAVVEWLTLVATKADREEFIECRAKHADGQWVHIEARASLVHDESGDFIVVNARDVSERRRDQEAIVHMAYHDALTGLPNRLLFADRLDVALAQARRNTDKVCLIAIDLDRFKIINDTLGHSTGDELLRGAAGRLEKLVRAGNTVARIGGDEFIILLAACESAEDGIIVAQRLVEAFRLPFTLEAGSYHSTASAGLSVFPDDGSDAESLLRAADIAMYAAKDGGRDTFRHYTPAMNDKGAGWLALEVELRRAIEEGELRVYYQPQVDVSSKQIVGAEALVRWQHPTRGLIAPMEFIPLAEEIGLIIPLGDFVLRQACRDAVQWQKEGVPSVRLAVNISHRQISDQRFITSVRQIVAESGLTPSLLELEITETAALRNIERTRAVAIGLAELGVRLSIDDFGAGSTSLRYLQDFPITTLKIDRSFITGINNNASNSAIATSVIALGHQLNLNVIAEGVETQEDLDFLKSRDCDEYQGFFCSRAVPIDELNQMLANWPTPNVEPAVASVSDAA